MVVSRTLCLLTFGVSFCTAASAATLREIIGDDMKKTSADWLAECGERPSGSDGECRASPVDWGVRHVICNAHQECFVLFSLAPNYIGPKEEEDDRYHISLLAKEAAVLADEDLGDRYVSHSWHLVDPTMHATIGPFAVNIPLDIRDADGELVKGPNGETYIAATYRMLLVTIGDKQTSMGREHLAQRAANVEAARLAGEETNAALPFAYAVVGGVGAALIAAGILGYVFLVPSREVTMAASLPAVRP